MMMHKFKVGDWFYDNSYFWKITGLTCRDAQPAYDVAWMHDRETHETFRRWGHLSHVLECELKPITNTIDTLRCRLSEVRGERDKTRDKLGDRQAEIAALIRTIEMIKVDEKVVN